MGSAFLLGFAGSLHCVLMCGPLMLLVASNKKSSMLRYHLTYHSGRIAIYGLLGLFAGFVGKGFTWAGGHQLLAILLGTLIILAGLSKLLKQHNISFKIPLLDKLSKWIIRKQSRIKTPSLLIKGMLNGLLPCGLVYVALAAAVVSSSILEGFMYMIWFGLGTTPVLLFIILFNPINHKIEKLPLQRILPWITIIFGVWLLVRGLGIGIHFWSPDSSIMNISNEMNHHH